MKIIPVALCLLLQAQVFSADPKITVSVMDLNTVSGLSKSELALLTEKLVNSLVEYRRFEIVERGKRDEILKEQGFQMSGACSEASCLVEIGQLLGAQKMIGGSIGKLGDIFVVELRMIDIKTGGIDLSFSRNYDKTGELLSAMKEAAEIFSSWKPAAEGLSAKPGGIFIISDPDSARILVDGKETGNATPFLVFPLAEGLHQVSLVKDGYSLFSVSRLVSVGKIDTINTPLMSLAGRLKMKFLPVGADIFLNGAYHGTTTGQIMLIEDLRDSVYHLKVRKWGYRSHVSDFKPSQGRQTKVDSKLRLKRWTLLTGPHFQMVSAAGSTDESSPFMGAGSGFSGEADITFGALSFEGFALGGHAQAGFNISRNFAINVMYQFKIFPTAIDIHENVSTYSTQTDIGLKSTFTAHSVLFGLSGSRPMGRLEPFAEIRIGGFNAWVKQEYEYQYNSDTSSGPEVRYVRDSTRTRTYSDKVDYLNWQAGGGLKIWVSETEVLQLGCMYSSDRFKDVPNHATSPAEKVEVDLPVSGLLFSLGHVYYF